VPRSIRQIPVADHLWDVYGRMAEEMGSDRDGLVNEAMHAYARLHGYVAPGTAAPDAAEPPSPAAGERRAAKARVLETAERLERDMALPPPSPPPLAGGEGGGRAMSRSIRTAVTSTRAFAARRTPAAGEGGSAASGAAVPGAK
jgi:hypothetical protein